MICLGALNFFIYEKIFIKQWLEQKETKYPPKLHLCYPKTKACINMESNNTQRKVIYPRIFYFGLESNPLKKSKSPAESPLWEPAFFHDASVLVGGDLTVVESNQSR